MAQAIVGVHGVWNFRRGETPGQAAETPGRLWHTGVATALRRAGATAPAPGLSVAYYADLLRKPGRQGPGEDLNDLDRSETEFARQ